MKDVQSIIAFTGEINTLRFDEKKYAYIVESKEFKILMNKRNYEMISSILDAKDCAFSI